MNPSTKHKKGKEKVKGKCEPTEWIKETDIYGANFNLTFKGEK